MRGPLVFNKELLVCNVVVSAFRILGYGLLYRSKVLSYQNLAIHAKA